MLITPDQCDFYSTHYVLLYNFLLYSFCQLLAIIDGCFWKCVTIVVFSTVWKYKTNRYISVMFPPFVEDWIPLHDLPKLSTTKTEDPSTRCLDVLSKGNSCNSWCPHTPGEDHARGYTQWTSSIWKSIAEILYQTINLGITTIINYNRYNTHYSRSIYIYIYRAISYPLL